MSEDSSLKKPADLVIHEALNKVRCDIDLSTEDAINALHDQRDELLRQLAVFEDACRSKALTGDVDKLAQAVNQLNLQDESVARKAEARLELIKKKTECGLLQNKH